MIIGWREAGRLLGGWLAGVARWLSCRQVGGGREGGWVSGADVVRLGWVDWLGSVWLGGVGLGLAWLDWWVDR